MSISQILLNAIDALKQSKQSNIQITVETVAGVTDTHGDRGHLPVFTTQSHTHSLCIVPPVVQVQLREVGSAPTMFLKTCAHIDKQKQTIHCCEDNNQVANILTSSLKENKVLVLRFRPCKLLSCAPV